MERKGRILVVGSLNMDVVTTVSAMPLPGETVMGKGTSFVAGGKGNNQAVAAAKLGAFVDFVGCVGNDSFGYALKENLLKAGVNDAFVSVDKHAATGVAIILVEEHGENRIILSPGANMTISKKHIDDVVESIKNADVVICQQEIPLDVVRYTLKLAKEYGRLTILDPAPAYREALDLLCLADIVTPNEVEAEILTGVKVRSLDDAFKAASVLQEYGARIVLAKLGEKGVLVQKDKCVKYLPGHDVEVKDTTAAGDTFNGVLAAVLVQGKPLEYAVEYANCAAALSVTRFGAQTSLPTVDEVDRFFRENKKEFIVYDE